MHDPQPRRFAQKRRETFPALFFCRWLTATPSPRRKNRITRLGLQPLADDGRALLAVAGPSLWKAVVDHVVALDAERVLDDLGGAVAIS
jgi:hypothetical protein